MVYMAMSGTKPSATKILAKSTKIMVNGIEAMNFPVTPERKKSGMNTAMVVKVPAMSGQASYLDMERKRLFYALISLQWIWDLLRIS